MPWISGTQSGPEPRLIATNSFHVARLRICCQANAAILAAVSPSSSNVGRVVNGSLARRDPSTLDGGPLSKRVSRSSVTSRIVHDLMTCRHRRVRHLCRDGAADRYAIPALESFRNDMWPTYKSSAGMDPLLLAQFDPLEDALRALGVAVWPMVDVEADDGLASAAAVAAADPRAEQVIICTPDKDLGQCVGGKVIQWDRRQDKLINADGVIAKFGVPGRVDPRLAGPRRRQRGWLPGPAGIRREVRSDAARPLRAPGRHPDRSHGLGRHGAWRGHVGGDARFPTRGCRDVQAASHTAHRRRRRHRRRLAVDPSDRGLPRLVPTIRLAAAGQRSRRLGHRPQP
jgi:hypothetical protein